jgi:hypothetical protein
MRLRLPIVALLPCSSTCIVTVAALWLSVGFPPAASGAASASATTTISAGNVRFEFLTPSLVRLEFSPSGKFVDAPTAVVQQRREASLPEAEKGPRRRGAKRVESAH